LGGHLIYFFKDLNNGEIMGFERDSRVKLTHRQPFFLKAALLDLSRLIDLVLHSKRIFFCSVKMHFKGLG
jgi:hypothetical protein